MSEPEVYIRIEEARAYLERHNLRVIRTYWPARWNGERWVPASPRPIMEVVPADDPRANGAVVEEGE